MKIRKKVLFIFMMIISIGITVILIENDTTANNNGIIQVNFTDKQVTKESIDIHAEAQCLDGYEIKAMQVDEQPKVENVSELDFTATENRDYTVKVYYQSLIEQKELMETFITTAHGIDNQYGSISMLNKATNAIENPDIITTSDGYTFDKSTGTITEYTQQAGITVLDIPKMIENVPVKKIEDAFSYNRTLIKVIIPDSVIDIGDKAFYYCSLKEVIIPDSVTNIGAHAFDTCGGLTSITIPNSVTNIGAHAFDCCKALSVINIPDSVMSIGEFAFNYCSSLKEISIPMSITTIEKDTFAYCTSLIKINIPNSVKNIGDHMFFCCYSLTEIEIPNSVTSIGASAFFNCESLKKIEIPDSVTSIGEQAFYNCISLTSITLPNSLTIINGQLFQNCKLLTKIDIPYSVSQMGYRIFAGCSSLKEVNIPYSIQKLGSHMFTNCPLLTKIILPPETNQIGRQFFGDCKNLNIVYIPDTVEEIYSNAFFNSGIKKVVVMSRNPENINLPEDSQLLNIEKSTGITLPLEWYRVVLTGDVNVKQKTIHSVRGQGRVMNLKSIFEDKGIKEVIYKGKTGTELYAGNDIEIPKDYLELKEGTDISMKYQIVGTPSSPDTKIIGDKLYIAADETASDLKVTANVLSTTKEVPIVLSEISSIAVKNEPQNTYTDGEIYNPKGLVITVTYNNQSQEEIVFNEDIKDDFTFAYDQLGLSNTKQIIGYKGKTFEHSLTVLPRYIENILENKNISVKGQFKKDSYLIVEKIENTDKKLIIGLEDKWILGQYEAKIVGGYKGSLLITFDVGSEYNNKKVYIKHLKQDGTIEKYEEIVVEGKVSIAVNELSPFVIYADKDKQSIPHLDIENIPNIVVKEPIKGQLKQDDSLFNQNKRVTSTEDKTGLFTYIVLLVGSGMMIYMYRKKKLYYK